MTFRQGPGPAGPGQERGGGAPTMSRVPRPRPQAAGRTIDIESVVRESYRDAWLLCRHLSDAQSADDLTQETFLRVQKALPGFRSDASVKTWVLSIARRTCADAIRRQNREHRKTSRLRDELWAGGATHVPDVADSVSLWALVSQLEVERRAAFVLTQFFGLFALTGKVTSFIGPLLIGIVTATTASQKAGMSVIVVLFLMGLALLTRVRD